MTLEPGLVSAKCRILLHHKEDTPTSDEMGEYQIT